MNSVSKQDYAVIGGGSVGPIAVIYLAEEFKKRSLCVKEGSVTIHAFDPAGFCNGGLAYKSQPEEHKLNSVYGEMSPWQPEAFYAYAKDKDPDIHPLEFTSRALYLDFLSASYEDAVETLSHAGVKVEEHHVSANVTAGDVAGSIRLQDQEQKGDITTLPADQVLLSVGYGKNENFPQMQSHIGKGYVHDIYDVDQIESEPALHTENPRILFIGNGPALYDFTNAYAGDPAKTQLHILSPSGEVLGVRDTSIEEGEQPIRTDLIEALSDDAGLEDVNKAIADQFEKAAKGGATPRRSAFDIITALKPVLTRISPEVAQVFSRSGECKRLVHTATPIPEESHARLSEFNPQIVAGRFEQENVMRQEDGTFLVKTGEEIVEVDAIINGTGHGRINHPVIRELLAEGGAQIDARFGTLATNEDGYTLRGSGIACIGPATHWGVDGIESFARSIQPLTKKWVDQIESTLSI
jgi:uncharacterized NAD(P)/FAD-binding protein YdhS